MITKERLEAIRKRAEKATEGNPLKDAYVLARMNLVILEDVPALLAEVERLQEVQQRLSEQYVRLFIDHCDLLDEVIPEWRDCCADLLEQLREAVAGE